MIALHPNLTEFPALQAPDGFEVVDKEAFGQLDVGKLLAKNGLEGRVVMFKWDSDKLGDPRGWFRGAVRPKAVTKEEAEKGYTHNVGYTAACTNGEIHGWVASELSQETYGGKWFLLKALKRAKKQKE